LFSSSSLGSVSIDADVDDSLLQAGQLSIRIDTIGGTFSYIMRRPTTSGFMGL
jgi:hypothetical protein